MADILLGKPEAGQESVHIPQSDDRLVLEFSPSDALLERVDDDLVFSFDDGSSVVLEDFYQAYNSENMPEFMVGEAVIPGEAFFAALDESLMPAAGQTAPVGSSGITDFVSGTLLDGLGREIRLDQEWEEVNFVEVTLPDGWTQVNIAEDVFTFVSDSGEGVLTIQPNGDFTFVPGENAPAELPDLDIQYTIENDNGDEEQGSLNLDLQEGTVDELPKEDAPAEDNPPVDALPDDALPDDTPPDDAPDENTPPADLQPDVVVETEPEDASAGDSVTGKFDIDLGDGTQEEHKITINGEEGTKNEDGTLSFELENGDLTLDPSTGDFTYDAKPDTTGTENIEITVVDKDGDSASTSVDIEVTKPTHEEIDAADAYELTVDEDGLGSDSDNADVATFKAPEGFTIVGVTGGTIGSTSVADDGSSFSYTLGEKQDHEDVAGKNTMEDADIVTVTMQDANGNTYEVDMDVNVVDAIPSVSVTTDDADMSPLETVTGNFDIDFGKDGQGANITINGDEGMPGTSGTVFVLESGVLILQPATGDFTFTAKDTADGVQDIEIVVTDKDGDTATASTSITVTNGVPAFGAQGDTSSVTTYDAGVVEQGTDTPDTPWSGTAYEGGPVDADNTNAYLDGDADGDYSEATGVIEFTSPDGVKSVNIGGKEVTFSEDGSTPDGFVIEGDHGEISNITLSGNAEDGYTIEYTYTQTEVSLDHEQDGTDQMVGDEQSTTDTDKDVFSIVVTDGNGDTLEGSIEANIVDDVIDMSNSSGDEIQMDLSGDVDDFGIFNGHADAGTLHDVLMPNKDANPDFEYEGYGWDVKFYDNQADDKSVIEMPESAGGFTISGAIVSYDTENGHSVVDQDASKDVELGWRVDNSSADGTDYANGIGMKGQGGNSDYEVGNIQGDFTSGDVTTEALIITLPEGETAYGVDLSLGCLFKGGSNSADDDDELVRLEFYRDGELVHTQEEIVGQVGGDQNFSASTVTVPFDEVRIIPTAKGSDFVLTDVDFSGYAESVVAMASGTLETQGADGVESVYFEGISVGGSDAVSVTEGSTLTLQDGTELTFSELGENMFVAQATDGDGNTDAYFTVHLNADSGEWTMHQHENFGDEINVTFGATDRDGDSTSLTVTVKGDATPEAIDDLEGAEVTVNEAGLDDASDDSDVATFKAPEGYTIVGVAGATEGNTEIAEDGLSFSYTLESAQGHEDGQGKNMEDSADKVTVTLQDAKGNTYEVEVDVNVVDDVPAQHDDYALSTNGTSTATGSVDLDFGADDGDGKQITVNEQSIEFKNGQWEAAEGSTVNVTTTGEGETQTTHFDFGDGKMLSTTDGENWTATIDGVYGTAPKDMDITITDSDGDSSTLTVAGTYTAAENTGDLLAAEGATMQTNPGEDYNVCVMLDTSGSMYDSQWLGNSIYAESSKLDPSDEGYRTRLTDACDALDTFLTDTLLTHQQSDLGGDVNVRIISFWGNSETFDIALSPNADGQFEVVLTDTAATGYEKTTQSYDSAEEAIDAVISDLLDVSMNFKDYTYESSDDYHHWTDYAEAMQVAKDFFDNAPEGYTNNAFLITDGKPTEAGTSRDQASITAKNDAAFNDLQESMGLDSGNGGEIRAVGMGPGVDQSVLDAYDTTGEGVKVSDSDISSLFSVEKGNYEFDAFGGNIADAGEGDDAIMSEYDRDALAEALGLDGATKADGSEYSDDEIDAMVAERISNDPEWLDSVTADGGDASPDALLGGAGDDAVYGQGGDDLLMGDGDLSANHLQQLAEAADMGDSAAAFNFDNLSNIDSDTSIEMTQNLVDAVRDAATEDPNAMNAAAEGLESTTDGNDDLFGGSGDDIMFGLNGEDNLFGGSGDDVLFGGSGNDMLDGGEGSDVILAGSGDDLIQFDVSDVFVDGGDGMDVLLVSPESKDAAIEKLTSGDGEDVTNVEMMVIGDVEGENVDEVMENLDGVSKSEDGSVTVETTGDNAWTERGTAGDFTEFSKGTSDEEITILVRAQTDGLS